MHRLFRPITLLIAALGLLSACGGGQSVPGADAPVESIASAATVTCTEADLTWPSDATNPTCSGPWQYRRYKSCQLINHPACGDEFCVLNNECASWSFGVNWHNDTRNYSYTKNDDCQYEPEIGQALCTPNWSAANATCKQKHDARRAWLVPDDAPSWVLSQVTSSWKIKSVQDATGKKHRFTCEVKVHYPRKDSKRDPSCGCQETSYPACVIEHPDCGEHDVLSADGLSEAGLLASVPVVPGAEPHCTTCENLPVETPADAQAKYECLTDSMSIGGLVNAEYHPRLKKKLMLLFELHGHWLTEAQRDAIRPLYADEAPAPSCGKSTTLDISDSCTGLGDYMGWNQPLARCQRLSSAHVAPEVVAMEADACFEMLTQAEGFPTTGCFGEYRTAIEQVTTALVEESARNMRDVDGEIEGITEALSTIDAWHTRQRTFVPDEAEKRLSPVLGTFWSSTHEAVRPTDGVTVIDESELLGVFEDGYAADRKVLGAAFSADEPMRSEALLPVVTDALSGLVERLEDAGAFQDLASRYRGTDLAGPTEISELWNALGTLHDANALSDVLATTTHIRPEYRTLLESIALHHGVLEDAYADATGADLEDLLAADVTPKTRELFRIVSEASERTMRYQASGLFEANGARALHAGIQRAKRDLARTQVAAAADDVQMEIASYRSNLTTLTGNLLSQIKADTDVESLKDRAAHIQTEVVHASEDLDSLRHRESVAAARYGDFVAQFQTFAESATDPDLLILSDQDTLTLSAADARYTSSDFPADVTEIAVPDTASVQPWSMSVEAGDFISIQTQGKWAPNCGLRSTMLQGPSGMEPIQIVDAETTTDGYIGTYTTGNFEARGWDSSTSRYSDKSSSTNVCAGLGFEVPIVGDVLGFSASVKTCMGITMGQRDTTTNSHSRGSRDTTQAQFAMGMRLPRPANPYEEVATGSLVLVATAPGDPTTLVDLYVARPSTAIIFDEPVDLYLVVNDRADCTVNSSPVTVHVTRSRPSGAVVADLGVAMADTLTELKSEAEVLENTGAVAPAELSALESAANDRLAAAFGSSLSNVPPVLRGFFDTWVTGELASIQRRVQMVSLMRQMELSALELDALAGDIETAGDIARMQQLVPRWTLRNLAANQLAEQTRELVDITGNRLYPVLELRYPDALEQLRADHAAELDALVNGDFLRPSDLMAEDALHFVGAVETTLETAVFGANDLPPVRIAVSFPRAGDGSGGGIFGPAPGSDSLWKTADPLRAATVWASLIGDGRARLEVFPEDLYSGTGGTGVLLCSEAAPVVEAMSVYAVMPGTINSDVLNDLEWRLPGEVDRSLTFPDSAGAVDYDMANDDFIPLGIPLIFGEEDAALSTFNLEAAPVKAGNGLSPFSAFSVDFEAVDADILDDVTALVLVFEVDPRVTGSSLSWIETCP